MLLNGKKKGEQMVFKFRRITYSAREAGLEGGKSFLEREEAEHPEIHEASQLQGWIGS